MNKSFAKFILFAVFAFLIFSTSFAQQYDVQVVKASDPNSPIFEIKSSKVATPFFTITLPSNLQIGNISLKGQYVIFSSRKLYPVLVINIYPKATGAIRNRLMQQEMSDTMTVLAPHHTTTPEEETYLKTAFYQTPQESKIEGRDYAMTAFTFRTAQVVLISTDVKNATYIFKLISEDDDPAMRQQQINAMMASVKSMEYIESNAG